MVAGKLDFIIRLARSGGAELAEELKYDASYISRIRNGKRIPPDIDTILEKTAGFLAGRITSEEQKRIAKKVVLADAGEWPEDENAIKTAIMNWFRQPGEIDPEDAELVRKLPRAKRKNSR